MELETVRTEIPALDRCRYLNWGASGPSPRNVVDAAHEFEKQHQYTAPCEEGMYAVPEETLATTRETVGEFIGAAADEIALTRNTVEGINHVATALDWEPDDTVVHTDLEHPAGELPWALMRDRHGIEIAQLETNRGRLDLDTVKDTVGEARLVCLSSLSWNFGTRLPVGEVVDIAHDAGAKVLVDAVQSVGQESVDVRDWGADFVAASGHKWLLGLWGSGFLYVDEDTLADLTPGRIGYFSVDKDETDGLEYTFRDDAQRFELGTTAVSQYAALTEAIETATAVGIDTVEARIAELADRLRDGLGASLLSPEDARSGLVTFAADDPEAVVDRLSEEGVQIRSLPEPDACRVSVHAYNTAEDIDRLLEILQED